MTSFYAVALGKQIGVYTSWDDCKKNVLHYPNAKYKKCKTQTEAEQYIQQHTSRILTREPKQNKNQNTKHEGKQDTDKSKNQNSNIFYVYTDGACINNGRTNASAGAGVFFGWNDPRNRSVPVRGRQTNNVAEATAMLIACKQIAKELQKEPNNQYVIVSDSKYAIQYATQWGEAQAQTGWMKDIANKDLVKQLYILASSLKNVSFLYIKAHTHLQDKHSLGNEQADRLAYQGIPQTNHKDTPSRTQKIYLNVPYAKKDEAKALGAKWDTIIKKWYTRKTHRYCSKLISQFLQEKTS